MNPTDGPPIALIAAALREERTRQGLSISEVAQRAGVAKSTLSQLEAAAGNPSIETLWALATCLQIPFAQLLELPTPSVKVLRSGEGMTVTTAESGYAATLLAATGKTNRNEIYRLSVDAGSTRESHPHGAGITEHVLLTSGRAFVGPSTDPVELITGDFITYPGDGAHIFRAVDASTAMLITEYR